MDLVQSALVYLQIYARDEGWAWVVLAASFCTQMLIDGTITGFGVIYAEMQKDPHFVAANTSDSQLMLTGAIQSCVYLTASMIFYIYIYFTNFTNLITLDLLYNQVKHMRKS